MTEDGQRWQAVDPEDRRGSCWRGGRYKAEDMDVTVCLPCGAEVQPVLAQALDLEAGG